MKAASKFNILFVYLQKHQEWLKLHNKLKSDGVKYTKWKSTFELPNLWRINKTIEGKQNSSINEVYAENETSSINANIIGNGNDKLEPTMASGLNRAQQGIRFDSAIPVTTPTSRTTSSAMTTPELKSLIAEEATLPTTIEDIPSTTTTTTTTTTTASTSTRRPKSKLRPFPRWANWGPWSECSRTCGGGVKHQIRKCIDR